MPFPFNIYLLAGLSGLMVSGTSLPLWRALCRRFGVLDDPGHRKIHREPIPLAGGLAVLAGILIPLAAGLLLAHSGYYPAIDSGAWLADSSASELLQHGFQRRGWQLLALFAGANGMTLLGFLDDKFELRPRNKFIGQLFIAGLTAVAGIRITLFVDNLFFSYAITILWIITIANAVNFLDNMNGLCAGLGIVATWCIGLQAMTQVHYLVASISFLACGALLGFLPYNFPRASVFLGDAGSHLTGYLLAVLAILPHFYSAQNPHPWAVLSPLLFLGVPLLDLVSVVYIRWRKGQPFYIGDTNHVSHRLVRRGLSPVLAVLLICLLAALLGALALCWS